MWLCLLLDVLYLKVCYNGMPSSKPHTARKYISPLNMNNLRGRMLNVPKSKSNLKTEFLVVYGQNSSLEKWFGLASELRNYGNVTMPDLPGFGGMQSFYKINEKPTLDNYADYLAAFIKLRYRRKKIVVLGLSFGFVVITRMLQRYPELTNKINLIINVSGFSHKEDININKWIKTKNLVVSKLFARNITSEIYNAFAHDEFIFKLFHKIPNNDEPKLDKKQLNNIIKFEISLQKKNDTKTKMYIINEILKLDNCQQSIDLPVWSLVGAYDEYLHADKVKSHLESIFSKYHEIKYKKNTHKGYLGAVQIDDIVLLIPYKLKVLLNRYNKQSKI